MKDVIDGYKSMREEAEAYRDTVREIEKDLEDARLSATESRARDEEDEATRNARNIEDIKTDHYRRLAELDSTADDYAEDRAKLIARFNQDLVDEETRHDRVMADIYTDFTRTMVDANEENQEEMQEAITDYEENRTTIADVFMGIRDDIAKYLTDKMLDTAFEWLTDSLLGLGTDAGTAATAVDTAMSSIMSSVVSKVPAIVTGLGKIALALVPLIVGFSDKVASGVSNANQWITENILGQHYGPGTWEMTGKEEEDWLAAHLPDWRGNKPLSPTSSAMQPALAGAGAGGSTIQMQGMFDGAVFNVQSELDASMVAEQTYSLLKTRLRAEGVRP